MSSNSVPSTHGGGTSSGGRHKKEEVVHNMKTIQPDLLDHVMSERNKTGSAGALVNAMTNYVRVKSHVDLPIYQFHVAFDPPVDNKSWREEIWRGCGIFDRVLEKFIANCKSILRQINMDLPEPHCFPVGGSGEANDYLDVIREKLAEAANHGIKLDMVVVILKDDNETRDYTGKKVVCLDLPVPSQCVRPSDRGVNKQLGSICLKILLQMNCKMGGAPWIVKKPPKRVMFIGYDLYADSTTRGKCVPLVRQAAEEVAHTMGQTVPQFAFILVTKKTNARVFTASGNSAANPLPGTVVDNYITRPERYDFYMVPQAANHGTVAAVHYSIIHDDTGYDADRHHKLAFKLCHLYYIWQGTVRVPAPCQYAHKLAFLFAQTLHREANERQIVLSLGLFIV
ncbi:unnamed protein product, partial [Mesorhabditis spiculigera]